MEVFRTASLSGPMFMVLIKKSVYDYIYNLYDHYSYEFRVEISIMEMFWLKEII